MPKNFSKVINGRNIEITTITGKVTDIRRWAETEVSSRGGGSVIAQGSGYINAPIVESTTYQKIEFWIKEDESGQEKLFNLTNSNFNVKNDQDVIALYSTINKNDYGLSFLYNKNANIFTSLNNESELRALGKKILLIHFFMIGFIYWLAILITASIFSKTQEFISLPGLIVVCLIASFLIGLFKKNQKNKLIQLEFNDFAYQTIKEVNV